MGCRPLVFVVACRLIFCNGAAAQASPLSDPDVYYAEEGVKSPKLASTDFSPVIANNCDYEGAGIIRVFVIVSAQGKSEKVAPLYPYNDDIDKAAVSIAEVDRFSPGVKDGVPVNVAQELEIKLTICRVKIVNKDGTTSARLRLKSAPVQKLLPAPKQPLPTRLSAVEAPITSDRTKQYSKLKPRNSAPVPLETPEAEWPPAQRGIQGSSLVSLVVDTKGQPTAMRVVRGTNEQFNEKALEAVEKYRFKPAKIGNDPVPVRILVVVNFKPI